jgi:riboflavin kinase
MKLNLEEIIHLTDLSFIRFCNEIYGVNRGVYNTIDAWFYGQGIDNIIVRRKNVLFFLEFINNKTDKESTRIKFGSGGLTVKLMEYLDDFDDNGLLKRATS